MDILADTGVILRLYDQSDPWHSDAVRSVNTLKVQGERIVIASQNIREFWNTCTRPTSARNGLGLSLAETNRRVTSLENLLPGLLGEPGRPVIAVHRIDRDTSGLVVFARTPAAAKHLTDQFRKHTADRRYLALVRGTPKAGRIESELVRDRGDGRRGSGTGEDAKRAVTHIKVIEPLGQYAAVECRLETGRTHQVRIHLGEADTPLCGECVYDRPLHGKPLLDGSGAKRPMLHAAYLAIDHPATGKRMEWKSGLPKDMRELVNRLRG